VLSTEIGNLGFNILIVISCDRSLANVLIPLPVETTDMEMTVRMIHLLTGI
jgi:hypothetical protein